MRAPHAAVALLAGCAAGGPADDSATDTGTVDTAGPLDSGAAPWEAGFDAYADVVVSFTPGPGAGYGQDRMPQVVFGPPRAPVAGGSLDVVSLGQGGSIVLGFDDGEIVDGPGPDLVVFENGFPGWIELGRVALSVDGTEWFERPCDPLDGEGGFPGCVGVHPVHANPDLGIDPLDPSVSGGDLVDLAELGLTRARFVRITDAGVNPDTPPASGFDLDAVAVLHRALARP